MLPDAARDALIRLLGRERVITDPGELLTYEVDAALDRGNPDAVVFPTSAEEVVRVVRWAEEHSVPLVARGAGTGLSGGAVARGGVIVEFSRMNRILALDEVGRTVTVQPGVVNQDLDAFVASRGLYYPPDPASGRACTLGGNVAENSGGPHCFKYGVTTNYVAGLDVVLADGRRMRLGGLALDPPEYDFCGLVTGSEGTLALVVGITVRLLRRPPAVQTMMAAFDSLEQAGEAVSAVIAAGLTPSTLEMMDQKIMGIVEDYIHPGLPVDAAAALIVEVDGYGAGLDPQMAEVAAILREHGARDLRPARSAEERETIWTGRKGAIGALARLAPFYLLVDGTVPRSRLAETLAEVDRICEARGLRVGHVFHAGDGNLHPLILLDPEDPEQVHRVLAAGREIMEAMVRRGGSITGEHGIGLQKREYMALMFGPSELEAMQDVKEVFDPRGLLNPGKIFPAQIPAATRPLATVAPDPFAPADSEEAAYGLAGLSAAGRRVQITGGGTKVPPREGVVRLSTERLRGISTYALADLYVVAGAGTPLEALQEDLARDRMWVPLASPWAAATLGGIVAANASGPLRMRYGGVRDLLLAATFVLSDGRVVRAGRPLVKNVAGYDLPKVLVGSYGTLALVTEVALKITPLPAARRTVLVPADDLSLAVGWGLHLLPSALVASAITVYGGENLPGAPPSPYLLAYTAEGRSEDVDAELAQVVRVLKGAGAPPPVEVEFSGTEIWARLLARAADETLLVRAGVPVAALEAWVREAAPPLQAGAFLVDVAGGLVYAAHPGANRDRASEWLAAIRRAAVSRGGYAVVLRAPASWGDALDLWGYRPESLDLMRGLKARWDPAGILNPGIFLL
ncbi:MAG: FAD-linked oxidase C-terminal domain-containing protein [Armatimonadota bacterium]|nr:FAD-linked oxidase C-terminal domain-containing protein [Armatimonadota bacterium]